MVFCLVLCDAAVFDGFFLRGERKAASAEEKQREDTGKEKRREECGQ